MEQQLSLNGAQVRYLDTGGAGHPLVFCHGNSSSSDAFAPLLTTRLSSRYRGIALDFHGHGGSSLPHPDAATVFAFVDMLRGFLQALGLKECVLVGHSLGGHVAMEALPQLADTVVRGLVCISAPPFSLSTIGNVMRDPVAGLMFQGTLSDSEAERVAEALVKREVVGEDTFRTVLRRVLATHPGVRGRLGRALAAGELADELEISRSTRVPLLFVQGTEDGFVRQDYLATLADHRGAPLSVRRVEGARHSPHIEAPDACWSAIAGFLRAIDY